MFDRLIRGHPVRIKEHISKNAQRFERVSLLIEKNISLKMYNICIGKLV